MALVACCALAITIASLFSAPKANAIELIPVCKENFEKFKQWNQYYKVFAYGFGGGKAGCTMAIGEADALAKCTELLSAWGGNCRVYARSPVNGKLAIVWVNEHNSNSTGEASGNTLGRFPDKMICESATRQIGTGYVWEIRRPAHKKEVLRRGLSIAGCAQIMGGKHQIAEAKNVVPNTNSFTSQSGSALGRFPDKMICESATRQVGTGYVWEIRRPAHKKEILRRGLSIASCAQILGGKHQVASANNVVSNTTLFTSQSGDALGRFPDKMICESATRQIGSGYEWEIRRPAHKKEILRRGLSLRECARLTGDEYKDSFQIAREKQERKRKEVAEQVRLQADVERKAEQELIRKAEAKKQQRLAQERQRKLTEARKKHLAPLRKKNRHSFAVIIGNKNYKGRTPTVSYAHNDADAMKRFVLDRLGYREGNVIDLRDATRNEIATMFGNKETHRGRLFNIIRAGKSDVMVYYSGHGVPGLGNRRPYLLPVDGDPNLAEITGYPVDVLYANLAKLPARSITVYLDACFSGESEKGMLISATSGISVTPKIPKSKSWMTVITAAQGDQFASWDEKAKHGLFTKHLLEALNGKADTEDFGNSDGKVSLAEVKSYLDDEMTYQARFVWNRQQKASVRGQDDTVLASVFMMPKGLSDVSSIEEMDATYTVLKSANLRAGPSTNTSVVGKLSANQSVNVTGKVIGKNWYRLNDGSYVFGSLIKASE
jgi:hypothetical protein